MIRRYKVSLLESCMYVKLTLSTLKLKNMMMTTSTLKIIIMKIIMVDWPLTRQHWASAVGFVAWYQTPGASFSSCFAFLYREEEKEEEEEEEKKEEKEEVMKILNHWWRGEPRIIFLIIILKMMVMLMK